MTNGGGGGAAAALLLRTTYSKNTPEGQGLVRLAFADRGVDDARTVHIHGREFTGDFCLSPAQF